MEPRQRQQSKIGGCAADNALRLTKSSIRAASSALKVTPRTFANFAPERYQAAEFCPALGLMNPLGIKFGSDTDREPQALNQIGSKIMFPIGSKR
ncbi:hypothetical protein MPL3356_150287 [Mesorhizobium plurifarium]|uniref:Uncharacterized protein n=1 Tax=Mesorhizobium plurifarium TaxID=69974 RepID=A0A090DL37_MESPL|nr:hypothetical protein MPL3356_150287 [Mesorhizobium plurifarium]